MNNGNFLHPEVRILVLKEFNRMRKSHPTMDGEGLMAMARDMVWTCQLADSAILRCELALETL